MLIFVVLHKDNTLITIMEQPKIHRELRLIILLSGPRQYTIQELAEELNISQRSIYRYLETFGKAGIDIVKVDDYKYRIRRLAPGVEDLSNVVYFSPEEAFIVNSLIDSLDPTNALKADLMKKLAAIYDETSMATLSDKPVSASKIQTLVGAIRDKKVVKIVGYVSSHSGKTKDYLVEPFEMTSNYRGVWAYDLEDGKNKRFIVVRMEDVVKTGENWTMAHAHHATPMDAFRIHGDKEYHVVLRMNNVAKNLMLEEYPLTAKDISPQDGHFLCEDMVEMRQMILTTHDMEDEEEEYWIYDGMVRGLDGIGRFVLSLEDNIEVMEGDELIEFLLQHANQIKETYE